MMDDEITIVGKATPLEFLEAVYCNNELPLHTRMKAAVEALPYVHPKLAVQLSVEGRDLAAALDRALARTAKVQTTTIEAKPIEEAQPEPVTASPILSPVPDKRYRR
jgi:hypothetical protein